MVKKTSAYYQREFRKRLREKGFVKKEVWILPENAVQLAVQEKRLRKMMFTTSTEGEGVMAINTSKWTTTRLYEALKASDLSSDAQATIEIIEGIEPSIQIIMHEYGDLPVFVTVSGDQLVAESILWAVSQVVDKSLFNEAVLRTHKYFPLSSISLDKEADGEDYYQMFGALSASSSLENVIFEIDILASNVIQATEAYDDFIKSNTIVKTTVQS
ncbi:MAG: YjfI family protein [gamma proteobacterium symbiont of Taylorina sp.]|nr:YjfI family protein [gamma proteobacterium symbiont of Taylorina sp.]